MISGGLGAVICLLGLVSLIPPHPLHIVLRLGLWLSIQVTDLLMIEFAYHLPFPLAQIQHEMTLLRTFYRLLVGLMAGLALLLLAFGQFWLVPYTELLYKAPLSGHEPIIGAPEQALIENRFLDFRRYLHQQMRPLAWLITISTLIVLLGFPLFFRVNLVNPLQALVQGTRQVNAGELAVRVKLKS